ncbi:MAG: thiamine phosphate synthase [Bacteroidales bacterium]|nr:thiamine phosphate synthase [Bacteroidales bacterium]
MVADPLRIVITGNVPFDNESERLATLLSSGWSYVHLRYPELTLRDVRHIIEGIPQTYHSRLKLHGHFELVNEFNLGGLHLNRRCPEPPTGYSGELSLSCHSVADVAAAAASRRFAYVTLSPVFASISKKGYVPRITEDEFREAGKMMPVIALGGIAPHKIPDMAYIPVAGYAVLGYLQDVRDPHELKLISDDFRQFEN